MIAGVIVKLMTIAVLLLISFAGAESPLPIMIWYGPPPVGDIREDLKAVRNAGFDRLLLSAKEPSVNLTLLEQVENVGLQAYLSDAAIDELVSGRESSLRRLDSLTLLYSRYRTFRGFLLYDKPGLKNLASFAELADFINGKYPALESFMQLHPLYATPASLDTTEYAVYLEQTVQKIKPKWLAYEHAGINNGGLRPDFFQNLTAISKTAREQRKPFWAFVMLEPVGQPSQVPHSHIRVQIYSGLSFGAGGVQYFAFRPPGNLSQYANASVVDADGRLTQTYLNCSIVNAEVRRLAPQLTQLTFVGVYAGKPAPAGVDILPPNLAVTKINQPDVLIGLFRDPQGIDFVLLVNTDIRTGKRCRVYFAPDVQELIEIAKDDAPPYRVRMRSPETDDYADLLFKAGDGRLFKIIK